jgi:hypothetical protein
MKIRLGTSTPPENYADGQILTAANLRELVTTLKAAINNNYDDLIKIIAGDNSIFVYDTVEALEEKGEELTAEDDGVYGVVLDYSAVEQLEVDALKLYQFDGDLGEFVLLEDGLSFISIIERLSDISEYQDDLETDFPQGIKTVTDQIATDLGTHRNISEGVQANGLATGVAFGHTKVINNLTTTGAVDGESLGAYQGKVLKDDIDKKVNAPTSVVTDERIALFDGTDGKKIKQSSKLITDLAEADHDHVFADIVDNPNTENALTLQDALDGKVDNADIESLVKDIEWNAYNSTTGEISLKVIHEDDTFENVNLDLKLELIPISASYDSETQEIVFTLDNNTTFTVPVADLVNLYYADGVTLEKYTNVIGEQSQDTFRIKQTWITDNIDTKLAKTGDGKDVTVSFSQAGTRVNISTGEKLSVIFGKIAKVIADLGDLAFLDKVTASEMPTDTVFDANYVHTDNNLTNDLKSNYDTAFSQTHTHANKTQLDAIVGTRSSIALNTNEFDGHLATIGAIKSVFNLPESDWDGNALTLGYKEPDVNATPDTVIVRDATGSAAIAYSNVEMSATTVVGALDELQLRKADVSALTSNIKLYATTADADVSGYKKMVSSLDDPAYNTTAVEIPTGTITTQNQLIASLVADAGLFVGNPGVISITTLGKIKKTDGNDNNYGEFYFEVYKRTEEGVETLQVTSDTTGAINRDVNDFREFSANALLNNGVWSETDRVVIKYYANNLGGSNSQYSFEFGGANPVRTLFPVPASVIPVSKATGILTNVANFNDILTGADDSVQKALDTLDDHNHDGDYAPLVEGKVPLQNLPEISSSFVDGGSPDTVYLDGDNFDAGSPDSVYA